MAGATSFSCTSRNANIDKNPTARFASNEKAPVLSGKQNEEQSYLHIPDDTNCEDPDITETEVPDDSYFDPALNDHEHIYFDPALNNYEPTRIDFFSIEPWEKDRLKRLTPHFLNSFLTPVVNNDNTGSFPPILPTPKNGKGLYHNLLDVLRTPTSSRPTLAAILDYYLLFPEHHSVKSCNLLISLSIHHRAYGITHKLFRSMKDRSIQYDMETHRLYIRWIIFKGFWDRAWSYAMQLKNNFPEGSIPFPIWLEFCHARRKGPIIDGTFNPITKKIVENVSEPESLIAARSNVMNLNRPSSVPALQVTPPVDIRNIVQLMVNSGLKHQAFKLTEEYFRILPLQMDSTMNHRCLNIVKIHMASNGKGKTSLPRFNAAKTIFFSLLSLNPSLRPTSDSLMFILSTLKGTKRCGTAAWKFISLCKERWGSEVEDRQIRRRVSNLALKEGRMDIVETLLREQDNQSRARLTYLAELEATGQSSTVLNKFLDRPPVRRIYPGDGRETYLWLRLRSRVYRTMKRRKSRLFTKHTAQNPRDGRETYLWQRFRSRSRVHRTMKKRKSRLSTKRKAQNPRFTDRRAQSPAVAKQAALTRKPTKSIPY